MAEGHGRDEWGRASVLLAMIANKNRDPKKGRPCRPDDFDPYAKEDRRNARADKESLGLLRELLENTKKKKK
jgi:hypothetical protein